MSTLFLQKGGKNYEENSVCSYGNGDAYRFASNWGFSFRRGKLRMRGSVGSSIQRISGIRGYAGKYEGIFFGSSRNGWY